MKKLKLIYSILLIAAVPLISTAQKYSDDIRQAMAAFNQPKLQLNAKVDVFANYSAIKPSQTYNAVMKKDGQQFYSQADNMQMLLNGKYLVMVYKDEKRIVYTKHDKNAEKKMKNNTDPGATIDSLLLKNDSILYKGVSDNMKLYIIYSGKSLIRRTEVYLDVTTGIIKRLVYYYNEQIVPNANKVKIDYTINLAPTFSPTEFSESRFLVINRGKATAAGLFAGYDVFYIDGENNNPEEQ